jgi:hypothetical protein
LRLEAGVWENCGVGGEVAECSLFAAVAEECLLQGAGLSLVSVRNVLRTYWVTLEGSTRRRFNVVVTGERRL